ncbi:MAG: Uma2 family endonuclease [Clostridiales bacterium]|nr:Uma2 family endonuclease [Clostridiales bacterium]
MRNTQYEFQTEEFTYEQFVEFSQFPENQERLFEFIDGFVYAMAAPTPVHERISRFLMRKLEDFLAGKTCEPLTNIEVYFSKRNKQKNVLIPDILVNCDPKRINETGCDGAPEFIIEIVSPSSRLKDYHYKKEFYIRHGLYRWCGFHSRHGGYRRGIGGGGRRFHIGVDGRRRGDSR